MTIKDAAAFLGVHRSRADTLMRSGQLHGLQRDGRQFVTRESVEQHCLRRDTPRDRRRVGRWPSRAEQRAIVQTLVLSGVITRSDIAEMKRERLATAIQKAER